MVDDPHNGEIAGVGLASSRFTGRGTADTDHPVPRLGSDGIHSHLFGAAVKHHLEVLVLKVRNPVGGDERFDDLDDEHDSVSLRKLRVKRGTDDLGRSRLVAVANGETSVEQTLINESCVAIGDGLVHPLAIGDGPFPSTGHTA